MGITIVQKSDLSKPKKRPKTALILAGGAVAGASFMAGGLNALGGYMEKKEMSDFDIFVGISAGSLLAAPLIAGIGPEEILASIEGGSSRFTKFSGWHYYFPNIAETLIRPMSFLKRLLTEKKSPSFYEMLPSGFFDNGPIEHYIRKNIEKNGLTNSFKSAFRATGKRLYVVASRLDDATRTVFGHDEVGEFKISEAIQASTAMPGFYKPVNLGGVDYVDGGVQDTASIDIAIEKGADLIVCYNPFRPHTKSGRLSGEGVMSVLNQTVRTFFHARLHATLEKYRRDENFKGDIILIEPKDSDKEYFDLNPLIFSNMKRAAALGFESVTRSVDERFDEIAKILAAYGIKTTKKKNKRPA